MEGRDICATDTHGHTHKELADLSVDIKKMKWISFG